MLRPLHILNRTAILVLGLAFAAAGQAPAPSKTQTPPPSKAPGKAAPSAPAAQKPAPPAAQKPATQKPAAQKPAKPAAKPPAKPVEKAAAEKKEDITAASVVGKRRDPFLGLISAAAAGAAHVVLPAGKAGLQVSTIRVDGIVRSANGMIVVVTSPQGRTYFLHQGDRVFDGRVEQVSMDGVTFSEMGKDPFGKSVEHTVVKRIYPSAGEQQ
ncbi:MAG TPA: hypothetical protein VKG84_14145 [Candidatus Acidoferrales bacterium]|nr:hypothetical protein [Candidatus Acidoferrales bacterium]